MQNRFDDENGHWFANRTATDIMEHGAPCEHDYDDVAKWAYSDLNERKLTRAPAPTSATSCPITAMVAAVSITRRQYPIKVGALSDVCMQQAFRLMQEMYQGPYAKAGEGVSFQSYVTSQPCLVPCDVPEEARVVFGLPRKPTSYMELVIAMYNFRKLPGYLHGTGPGYHPIGAPAACKTETYDYILGTADMCPAVCEMCLYAAPLHDVLYKTEDRNACETCYMMETALYTAVHKYKDIESELNITLF